MKHCMPEAYKELVENCKILEHHYKDMMVKYHFHWPSEDDPAVVKYFLLMFVEYISLILHAIKHF